MLADGILAAHHLEQLVLPWQARMRFNERASKLTTIDVTDKIQLNARYQTELLSARMDVCCSKHALKAWQQPAQG